MTSGGHSPASFIVLNELPKPREGSSFVNVDSPVDLSRWKEYFLAHEIAHQWWGQCVTWKNYQDQWISEGLAQFAALLYLKDKHGPKNFRLILKKISRWAEKKADWGAITLGARISYFDIKAYQAIVYNKSSLVLNMLKDMLGDELFFKGLTEFFSRFKFHAASTKDFFNVFQDATDKDLTTFFEKWFNSFLLPDAKISYSVDKVENQYILNINVAQHRGLFVFPLWIEWRENGSTEQRKILVEKMNQEYQFVLREKPGKVVFNPDRAVPGRIR
jgi:aminopeptidase N